MPDKEDQNKPSEPKKPITLPNNPFDNTPNVTYITRTKDPSQLITKVIKKRGNG